MADEESAIGTEPDGEIRCGYVALLGAPNVGKSTLLNRLVGAKVSIVTPKVQTTRNRVLGIAVTSGDQIVYVDTPGIFTPQKRLDRAMVAAAWGGAADADVVVVLADAKRGLDADSGRIVAGLAKAGRRALLALNKIEPGATGNPVAAQREVQQGRRIRRNLHDFGAGRRWRGHPVGGHPRAPARRPVAVSRGPAH